MTRAAKKKSALALLTPVLAGACAMSLACAVAFNSDLAIERGFSALITHNADLVANNIGQTDPVAAKIADTETKNPVSNIVSGSEDYWLRASLDANGAATHNLERVIWHGPVAAGGTLVIGSGSSRKELEVIAVERATESPVTRIDMTMGTPVPLRVQARDGQDSAAPAQWIELTHPVANTTTTADALPTGHAL